MEVTLENGRDVAAHAGAPREGMTVSGSPFSIGDTINMQSGKTAAVSDIASVWKGGQNIGWVYSGTDGQKYWQANHQEDLPLSYGVDVGLKGTPIGVHAGYNSATGYGTVEPLKNQIPSDAQVFQGFDRSLRAEAVRDGRPADGRTTPICPESVGDTIPNGTKAGTAIRDINNIVVDGGVKGWMYSGSDGRRYVQYDNRSDPSYSAGIGVKAVGADAATPGLGKIEPWNGRLPPGAELQPAFAHSRQLAELDHPYDASTLRLPREGQGVTGTIDAMTPTHAYINAGRQAHTVVDRNALPPDARSGYFVQGTFADGRVEQQVASQQLDRGCGIERTS